MAISKGGLTSERILSQGQAKALLKELRREKEQSLTSGKKLGFVMDYYLIQIAMATGLRISELAALTWLDVHEDYLIVQKGKGGKKREVIDLPA